MVASVNPSNLWLMSREDFNAWRRANDLPDLLKYLQCNLPSFVEWQNESQISDAEFLLAVRPSKFFMGDADVYLRDGEVSTNSYPFKVRETYISEIPMVEIIAFQKKYGMSEQCFSDKKFSPYFRWYRNKFRTPYFPIRHRSYKEPKYYTSFLYNSWMAPDAPSKSRASLFGAFAVLKLGGVRIDAKNFDDRNLDFVDIDFLEIEGKGHGDRASVAYASCRNILISSADKAFIHFDNCSFGKFRIESSRIQDLHISQDGLSRNHGPDFAASDSRLFIFSFSNCVPAAHFENCYLDQYFLLKIPKSSFNLASNFFRSIRVAQQERGNRRATAGAFYEERWFEMLSIIFSWNLGFIDLYWRFRAGELSLKALLSRSFNTIAFPFRSASLLRRSFANLFNRFKIIWHFLDYVTWGFGERPWRAVGCSIVVIALFGVCFYFSSASELRENFYQSIFCSTYSFLTLGCGIVENNADFFPLVAFEGFLGVIFTSLLVAGLSHKSRY